LIASVWSATAFAQDEQEPADDTIIINAWSDPESCNIGIATRISFEDLASGDQIETGSCVVVEGIQSDRALFRTSRDARSKKSTSSDRLRGRRIGLYANWEAVGDPFAEPRRIRVVGLAGDCSTQWPGAMMVMGYCHYTGGPILLVSEMTELSGN
jgi:hypothetical protein